ncbi:hypothetical protein OGAPHI_003999 [Ogataea philodendri]|uniref:Pre-mRNA-splicing factor 18 n=1 Tax=Ogataea philodendri TaxID=1378263 RepID=A0A9P8T5E0_9ASCO|nr:uncharacterized protein OGAPHI_003999 [Ogataea philodendri]KAH3665811.1 hypothetical protein OGAPHI_003999 [Ogataea philodendri]
MEFSKVLSSEIKRQKQTLEEPTKQDSSQDEKQALRDPKSDSEFSSDVPSQSEKVSTKEKAPAPDAPEIKPQRRSNHATLEQIPVTAFSIRKISIRDDPKLIAQQCRDYIKYLLGKWEAANLQHSTVDLVETKKWLFPLLVKLRKQSLPLEQLTSLATIMYELQQHNYNHANEAYLKLSIGNVAWPIGLTNIGIRVRTGHLKVKENTGTSNIMKDEQTRQWILAIKRIITFCETAGTTLGI